MKNWYLLLFVVLQSVLTGCQENGYAADTGIEYEFLTPQLLVVKSCENLQIKHPSIRRQSYWTKEEGLKRDRSGKIMRRVVLTTFHYCELEKPLSNQTSVTLETSRGKFTCRYSADIPSRLFKLNQVGNGSGQKQKYAYLGAWLGNGGAFSLKHLAGKDFELRNNADGKTVYKNRISLRKKDPLYQDTLPFTGEEVAELDYSNFNIPGTYYFYVEGIGRSITFRIGPESLSEAFYIHARGLYHKRCGIAKTQPYTAWISPACHQSVMLGRFPGNWEHYRKGKGENDRGFSDRKGNRIDVRHFDLIQSNPPYKSVIQTAPGGWHDAADYDRRPYHLRIVNDLATVYLMKPENFIDGQLNLPESGNGIPDILDEAAWGVKHLLAVQQSDGGVGTWFETTGHPGAGEGLPDKDKRTYYVSAPSRNGTLEYAAAVSTLALAMKKAGASKEAAIYLESARKAWHFALKPEHRLSAWFRLKDRMITYTEEPLLYGESLLKAGVNLYHLTGDTAYLSPIFAEQKRILDTFCRDFWKWSPLSWMILELYPVKMLSNLHMEYRKVVIRDADKMLADQENAYPYRTLWHRADAGWVHAMAWGNYHPLRRAMTLIAAHTLTGREKYRTGAYLANDFHNGANPLGRSMTSGLGHVYPVVFLDLVSYADGIGEFVPGITPYGNTFGMDRNAKNMVYKERAEKLPVFRRYINLEFLSVPASEYSVWETIAPATVTSGYLLEKADLPSETLKMRKPAADFRKLPGYRALP